MGYARLAVHVRIFSALPFVLGIIILPVSLMTVFIAALLLLLMMMTSVLMRSRLD